MVRISFSLCLSMTRVLRDPIGLLIWKAARISGYYCLFLPSGRTLFGRRVSSVGYSFWPIQWRFLSHAYGRSILSELRSVNGTVELNGIMAQICLLCFGLVAMMHWSKYDLDKFCSCPFIVCGIFTCDFSDFDVVPHQPSLQSYFASTSSFLI